MTVATAGTPPTARLVAYVKLERETAALDADDDPRADQVRDQMDAIWFALTLEELEWLDARQTS